MAQIDRNQSKKAIDRLIEVEEKKVRELKERRREREADHRDTSDLDEAIENENWKIIGKKAIWKVVDELDSIDAEIEKEQAELEADKKEIARLRGLEPKPEKEIQKLARKIDRLEKTIAGKKEAKGVVVYE